MHTLRCEGNTIHGRMLDDHTLEVKCKRRRCGVKYGVVVLHTFDIRTGKLIDTKRYADPRKELVDDASKSIASVRAS